MLPDESSVRVVALADGLSDRDHHLSGPDCAVVLSDESVASVSLTGIQVGLPMTDYIEYSDPPCVDPRTAGQHQVMEGLLGLSRLRARWWRNEPMIRT
jgi:hypothetical protein